MSSLRTPAKHFAPLAIGAPEPLRQLPVTLERMIHFVPPAQREDPQPAQGPHPPGRRGARQPGGRHSLGRQGGGTAGLHRHGQRQRLRRDGAVDPHQRAQLAVGAGRHPGDRAGRRRQARRDHAAEGRGAVGHPLPRSAAGPARGQARPAQADPDPRHPGDGRGRQERRGHRRRQPAHARHEPGPGRSRRLARHEDDPRRRRPSGLRHPGRSRPDRAARARSSSRTCGTTRWPAWSMPA